MTVLTPLTEQDFDAILGAARTRGQARIVTQTDRVTAWEVALGTQIGMSLDIESGAWAYWRADGVP